MLFALVAAGAARGPEKISSFVHINLFQFSSLAFEV